LAFEVENTMMKILSDLRLLGLAAVTGGASAKSRSIGDRLRVYLRSGGEGQALVEFSLVLPMLLMVLMGIFSVGMFVQSYQQLTYVENQGLITLQQLPDTAGAADPCAAVSAAVIGAAAHLNTTGSNGLRVSIKFNTEGVSYPASGASTPTGFTCSGGSMYVYDGQSVTVTVTYPCSISVYGIKFTPNCNLNETETEQI
jgi:Flp pilus assembly protein TadG